MPYASIKPSPDQVFEFAAKDLGISTYDAKRLAATYLMLMVVAMEEGRLVVVLPAGMEPPEGSTTLDTGV